MSGVDPRANEAAMRYLADEITRLQLLLGQAIGNLAWKDAQIAELQAALATAVTESPSPEGATVSA